MSEAGTLHVNRREFSSACLAGAISLATGQGHSLRGAAPPVEAAAPDNNTGTAFKLRGVYFHDGFHAEPKRLAPLYWQGPEWRRQIEWLAACGINAVEFATMLEFNRIPTTRFERNKIADRLKILDLAHQRGLKFGYILSNTVVSTVPEGEKPGNQLANRAVQLCPLVPGNLERTMDLQTWYIDTYKEADFFEEFAADWGACFCGKCDVQQYLCYVKELAHRVDVRHRSAPLYANTWCVSYWGPNPVPRGWRHVFEQETTGTRAVIAAIPNLPGNVQLALPCHNLYRQLAFHSFGGKQQTPKFPKREDLIPVRQTGRHVLAWPHFVMDDDVSRAPQWGLVHSEARYIRAMLNQLHEAGIAQVIGNLYLPTLQLSNAYVFGRLTASPRLPVEELLKEFAQLIVQRDDVQTLTDVLCWFDNNSYWSFQLPADAREPLIACSLDKQKALNAAKAIRARASTDLPLPVPAAQWLEDLAASIPRMTWVA